MSNIFATRKLVFKPTEQFEVNLSNMNRESKLEKINSFAQHDRYQVKYKDGFIHLLDKISVESGECPVKKGIVAYFSNRCPYSEYHVRESLIETANKRNLPLKIIKLDSMEKAKSAPTPATIFSLFLNGKFVTTDLSVCMDSRFDRIVDR